MLLRASSLNISADNARLLINDTVCTMVDHKIANCKPLHQNANYFVRGLEPMTIDCHFMLTLSLYLQVPIETYRIITS